MGTLGAGNHYCEIQVKKFIIFHNFWLSCWGKVVDEIYDVPAANKMGIVKKGQIVIMIHSGSRGLGHQVQTN